MKASTTILRGLNGIRASYILESELPETSAVVLPRPSPKSAWKRITSNGWFVAAVCAIVALGTLAGIIWAGRGGPGGQPPVGTRPSETTAETETPTDPVTEAPETLRGLKKQTTYKADGTEDSRTEYTYEDGLLVKERSYIDGRGFAMTVYSYNENGLVIQEKHTFDGVASAGWTTTYEYDGEGRVVLRRDAYDSDKPTAETRTEYDEQGRISREESRDRVTTYTYSENNSYISMTVYKNEDTVTKLERILDERGNIIRERSYRNEELTHDYVFEYNEDGQQIRFRAYQTDDPSSLNDVATYDYDENGNLVLVTYTEDEKVTSTHSYAYNEYGECTQEIFQTYMDSEPTTISMVVYEYGFIS